jgi:hypothetical protein
MTSDAQTKCYNAIGMIFAYALRNHRNILIGNHFHPLLYQMLHSLTPQEVTLLAQQQDGAQLPPTIYKKWLKAYLKSQYADYFVAPLNPGATEQQQRDYLAALNAAVDTFVDNEQAPLPQPMIDQEIQSRQEFFENAPQIGWALDAFKILAGSMARHLPNIQDNWNHWKGAAPQDLQNKIEGVLTKEKVLNAFWPGQNYPAQNTRDGFLKRWIDEANPEQLKKFVWAISGSYSMPDGVRFWIQNPQRDGNLPVFHTCGRAIDLSQYATYEAFNQALMIALNNLSEDGAFGVA